MAGLLIAAAARDVATRIIPNGVVAAIAALGLALRLGAGLSAALLSLALGLLLLVGLMLLASRGWLGGGDVKLAAALVAGLSPAATLDFLVGTILAGGILGLVFIAGRHLMAGGAAAPRPPGASLPARILAAEARRLRRGGPLPYAVAIAFGAIFTRLAGV